MSNWDDHMREQFVNGMLVGGLLGFLIAVLLLRLF